MDNFTNSPMLLLFLFGAVIFIIGLCLYLFSKRYLFKKLGIALWLTGVITALIAYFNGGTL